ncbi:MAG: hypothetical protein RAK24_04845, partial [TACK group archaeon]|nr:hypothetical protein [TACK group archaeon]
SEGLSARTLGRFGIKVLELGMPALLSGSLRSGSKPLEDPEDAPSARTRMEPRQHIRLDDLEDVPRQAAWAKGRTQVPFRGGVLRALSGAASACCKGEGAC